MHYNCSCVNDEFEGPLLLPNLALESIFQTCVSHQKVPLLILPLFLGLYESMGNYEI